MKWLRQIEHKPSYHAYAVHRSIKQFIIFIELSCLCAPPCSGGNDHSLHCTVSKMVCSEECSLWIFLYEHLRSVRRLFHFRYHEVHQRNRAFKHHHRMARLTPGHVDSLLQHYLDHFINLHGVGKGCTHPILHVLLDLCAIRSVRLSPKFKLRDLVTWRSN